MKKLQLTASVEATQFGYRATVTDQAGKVFSSAHYPVRQQPGQTYGQACDDAYARMKRDLALCGCR